MIKFLFLFLVTFSSITYSQDYFENEIYKRLAKDFIHELDEYDDVKMSPSEKSKLKAEFNKYLHGEGKNPLLNSYKFVPDYVKIDTYEIASTVPTVSVTKMDKLSLKNELHSIQNIDSYLKNRLGQELFSISDAKEIDIIVHAGDRTHLLDAVGDRTKNLVKIPSFYEKWGLYKYVDIDTLNSRAKVYINIPPIAEYAEHYRHMLSFSKGNIEILFNETDKLAYKNKFKEAVNFVIEELDVPKQSHFTLGYLNQVEESLSQSSKWNIVSSRIIDGDGEIGIIGKVFEVQSKSNPSVRSSIVSIGAKSTLWGEASAFLVEGILEHNPKGIYFMGSAGSFNNSHNIYDLSVADKFIQKQNFNQVNIENIIYQQNEFETLGKNVKSKVNWGGGHGNSYSPSEQSQSFLQKAKRQSLSTIDVEQSLIAKSIAEHNIKGANVAFGAVNIVTDKPRIADDHSYHLDSVDDVLKQKSRLSAVELTLDTIHEHDNYILNSDEIRKKMIMEALPNVPESNIIIKNGAGRVVSNKEFKMSYYIRTINPQDPMSKVQLIPMATSRYDRFNYNTDEWWDKYGEARMRGEKVPHEDADEVAKFLKKNNLSTNPDVHILQANQKSKSVKLKDFLLERYLEMYSEGKDVVLYRGIGKMEELGVWRTGTVPRGVRYWTPNANYAWRYARKRENFITNLISDNAPIVKFKIPKEEFVEMVRRNEVVLGTELPKSAHQIFDSAAEFGDNLNGLSYLGDGKLGVEHEIRFRKRGREKLPKYFVGAVTPSDLGIERIKTLNEAYARLIDSKPAQAEKLIAEMNSRIIRVKAEMEILGMMDQNIPHDRVMEKFNALAGGGDEIIHNDFERLASVLNTYSETSQCFSAFKLNVAYRP